MYWVPLIWVIAALVLAGAEALTGDLFLLMLAGGAIAAGGASLLHDGPVWIDGIVFLVVSVLLLGVARPALRKRLDSGHPSEALGIQALEGKGAKVLERINRHEGQVKLDGEVWTARPLNDDDEYEPGEDVTVMRIDGATAVVWKNA
ncbi:MAG: NfeD family protein [Mycobacterium sp.]